MADPLSFASPADVQAQIRAERQAAMGATPFLQMQQAIYKNALDSVFGNPEVRRAQKIEKLVKTAQAVKPEEGEDDIDTEIRRLKALRDGLVDIDPNAASQLNMQLLQLGEAKFQRSQLKAQDARAVAKEEREQTLFESTGDMAYVIDKGGKATPFDINDPHGFSDFDEARKQPGNIVLTPDQMAQLYTSTTIEAMRARRAIAESKEVGPVERRQALQSGKGVLAGYTAATQLANILTENPDALAEPARAAKGLDSLLTNIGAAARAASGGVTKEGTAINSFLEENSVASGRARGLVIAIAYTIALARDPNGRISDRDLIAAMESLGGDPAHPNPSIIMATINDNLNIGAGPTSDFIEVLTTGTKDTQLSAMQAKLNERRGEWDKSRAKFGPAQKPKGETAAERAKRLGL